MKPTYWRWHDAIFDDENLRIIAKNGYQDIRVIAVYIAGNSEEDDNDNRTGANCFTSAEKVGRKIGCHRKTAERYRKQLIDLGWFRETGRNGGANRRSLVLEISLPGEANGNG